MTGVLETSNDAAPGGKARAAAILGGGRRHVNLQSMMRRFINQLYLIKRKYDKRIVQLSQEQQILMSTQQVSDHTAKTRRKLTPGVSLLDQLMLYTQLMPHD